MNSIFNRSLKLVSICFVCSLLANCAIGPTKIALGYESLPNVDKKRTGEIIIKPFVDARKSDQRRGHKIGNKRNMYGMVLGSIETYDSVSLDSTITSYFAQVLRNIGYNVVIAQSSVPADATNVLEGEIKDYWLDMYMMVWHNIDIDLKLSSGVKGSKPKWSGCVQGKQSNALMWGVAKEFEEFVYKANTNMLKNAEVIFSSDSFSNAVRNSQ
jgi:hypothetical protein